jgi:hypothetical protein
MGKGKAQRQTNGRKDEAESRHLVSGSSTHRKSDIRLTALEQSVSELEPP